MVLKQHRFEWKKEIKERAGGMMLVKEKQKRRKCQSDKDGDRARATAAALRATTKDTIQEPAAP